MGDRFGGRFACAVVVALLAAVTIGAVAVHDRADAAVFRHGIEIDTRDQWPVKVMVAGDSTGVELAGSVADYAALRPGQIESVNAAFYGCGLTAADDGRLHSWQSGNEWIDLSGCTTQWRSIPGRVRDEGIDIVLVSIGPWDGDDIKFADGRVVSLLEPEGLELVENVYRRFVGVVEAAGARVIFVTPPDFDIEWTTVADPLDDPARWEQMRGVIDSLGVQQVDLEAWLDARRFTGAEGRPDGVHLAPHVRDAFVAQEVGPTLLAGGPLVLLAG